MLSSALMNSEKLKAFMFRVVRAKMERVTMAKEGAPLDFQMVPSAQFVTKGPGQNLFTAVTINIGHGTVVVAFPDIAFVAFSISMYPLVFSRNCVARRIRFPGITLSVKGVKTPLATHALTVKRHRTNALATHSRVLSTPLIPSHVDG